MLECFWFIMMMDQSTMGTVTPIGQIRRREREREFDLKRARSFSFVLPLTACHQDGLRIRLEQKTITPLG
jgi:hypothetical protein